MSFKARKELGNLLNTQWYKYAVERTGVAMPNCFTYATARISEILGRNQSLDGGNRVRGAGDLWENHAQEFTQSKFAVEGALGIFKGGDGNYGHVMVVEDFADANTCIWSESNYGANMFGLVTRNPNGYAGLQFMGYLIHNDLPKVDSVPSKPVEAPQPSGDVLNSLPSDFVRESATFTSSVDHLNIRRAPSLKGKLTGDWYNKSMSFSYEGYVKRDGYVWVTYIGKDNTRRWVAVREVASNKAYGTFK